MTLSRLNLILFALILILSFVIPPIAMPYGIMAPKKKDADPLREGEVVTEIFVPYRIKISQISEYIIERITQEDKEKLKRCEYTDVFFDYGIRLDGALVLLICKHPKGALPPAIWGPIEPIIELGR